MKIRLTNILVATILLTGCATLTNDPMVPVAISFSDGSEGECTLSNERGVWSANIPSTLYVRRDDESLMYRCKTDNGDNATGAIPSSI